MGRSTTRIQNLTKVTTLNTGDVFPTGPISGDRSKGIAFSDLLTLIDENLDLVTTIVEVTGDYTVRVIDDFVANTGPSIITLPASTDATREVSIKSVLGGGTLIVNPVGLDTVNGISSVSITANAALTFWPVNAGWLTT